VSFSTLDAASTLDYSFGNAPNLYLFLQGLAGIVVGDCASARTDVEIQRIIFDKDQESPP